MIANLIRYAVLCIIPLVIISSSVVYAAVQDKSRVVVRTIGLQSQYTIASSTNYKSPVTVGLVPHRKNNPSIADILNDSVLYSGGSIKITGQFRGNESGHGNPPVTRSDWVLYDGAGFIYVSGNLYGLFYPMDVGKAVTVKGQVKMSNGGVPYIETVRVGR